MLLIVQKYDIIKYNISKSDRYSEISNKIDMSQKEKGVKNAKKVLFRQRKRYHSKFN